jgi:hypothetical protein
MSHPAPEAHRAGQVRDGDRIIPAFLGSDFAILGE